VDEILQLGLDKPANASLSDGLVKIVWLLDQLLELVAENISDIEPDDARNFRARLRDPRHEILNATGMWLKDSLAHNTLELCRNQFEESHSKRLERDEHIGEIILLLRNSLANLTGDSKAFHESLMGTSDRIRVLTRIKDIQELKNKVIAEVDLLNRVVSERQKKERQQFAHFSKQIAVLQDKLEEAKTEASMDALTGIANRRTFEFVLQRWIAAHQRNESPFTICFLDIDDFKRVNDSCGHQIGD